MIKYINICTIESKRAAQTVWERERTETTDQYKDTHTRRNVAKQEKYECLFNISIFQSSHELSCVLYNNAQLGSATVSGESKENQHPLLETILE